MININELKGNLGKVSNFNMTQFKDDYKLKLLKFEIILLLNIYIYLPHRILTYWLDNITYSLIFYT